MSTEKKIVEAELSCVLEVFSRVVQLIPAFNITERRLLPYGLKPHTRSVSWIIEQVITQQAKYKSQRLGLMDVDIDQPDTSLHDCILIKDSGKRLYVNVKVTSTSSNPRARNDIVAVEKAYMQYRENENYNLVYAVFKFSFDNITITINPESPTVFALQCLNDPIYINPRNDKIQSGYDENTHWRTREEFLEALKANSKSIVLQ